MKDWKAVLGGFGVLALILLIGGVASLALAGISYGIQWLWVQISFGFAGLILGIIIVGITAFLTYKTANRDAFGLNLDSLTHLGILSIIGFLYGFGIIFSSFLWFFLPVSVINSLPGFGEVIYMSFFAGLLFTGVIACVRGIAYDFTGNIGGSLFLAGVAVLCLFLVNLAIWQFIKSIPTNYQSVGILSFLFIIFAESLFLIFFGVIPARQDKRRDQMEAKTKTTD